MDPATAIAGAAIARETTRTLAEVIGMMYGAVKTVGGDAARAVSALERFFDRHITDMKGSTNPTIERSGHILEAAKTGFGIGYFSSVAIIATGQVIMGQTAAALAEIAAAGALANPVAMTCGAVGAILYGYAALSEREKAQLWKTVSDGLQMGIELVKSIIGFVIDTAKKLLSEQTRREIRQAAYEMRCFIAGSAALFGRTVSDVTGTARDRLRDMGRALGRRLRRSSARKAKVGDLYNPRAQLVELSADAFVVGDATDVGLAQAASHGSPAAD